MADWGFKMSQTGYDVSSASTDKLVFTTGARTVRVFATGTATVTIPSANNTGETVIFMTYYNNSGEVGNNLLDYMPTVFGSTTMNGRRYRSNTPALYVGGTSPDDFHSFTTDDSRAYGQASRHFLDIGRTASASTAGTTENFTVRWYIVGSR